MSPTTSSHFFDFEPMPPVTSLPTSILVTLTPILRMPNDIASRVSPYKSLEMRLVPSSTVPISLYSSNLQSIASCSTFDNSISGHGQSTQTVTPNFKVAMLLGSIPPKLDEQHEKAWVLLTFPTCTQLIYSLQSYTCLTQPSVSPVPSPLASIFFPPPSDDIHCQVCQSPFDRCSSVTYVTQDGIWTSFSHPLPLSHMESGNVPYASRATSYHRQQLSTFAFLPPFSISTLIKIFQINDSLSLVCASGLPITIYLIKKIIYLQTLPPEFRTKNYMHAYS